MSFDNDFDQIILSPNHGGPAGTIVALCFHDTESSGTAAQVARYFAIPTTQASTTGVFSDVDSAGCVPYGTTAWHSGAGSGPPNNWNGAIEGYEHVGFARWSRDEWMSHGTMLEKSARHFARRCLDLHIPIRKVTPAQLELAVLTRNPAIGGICSHHDITLAARVAGGHTDPGPNFPWDYYIARVQFYAGIPLPTNPPPPPGPNTEDEDMAITPRPSWLAEDELHWLAFTGEIEYLDSSDVAKSLRQKGLLESTPTAVTKNFMAALIKVNNGIPAYNAYVTSRQLDVPLA